MTISPCRPQPLAHGLYAGTDRQSGAVKDEGESSTAVVEGGVVGDTGGGTRVGSGCYLLSSLTQFPTLTPRLTGRHQTPLGRARYTHLHKHTHTRKEKRDGLVLYHKHIHTDE